MLLRAKIGTLSLQLVVARLRRSPEVGQVFQVYEHLNPKTRKPAPGYKPVQVLCRDIINPGTPDAFWLLERW